MEKHSSQLAQLFENILKSTVVYTSNEGIMLMRNYERKGDEIIYSDVLTTAKSKLYYLVSSGKKLKILDKNSFTVDEAKIEGKEYGIMVFS